MTSSLATRRSVPRAATTPRQPASSTSTRSSTFMSSARRHASASAPGDRQGKTHGVTSQERTSERAPCSSQTLAIPIFLWRFVMTGVALLAPPLGICLVVQVAPRLMDKLILAHGGQLDLSYRQAGNFQPTQRTRASPLTLVGSGSGMWSSMYLMPSPSATHSTAYPALNKESQLSCAGPSQNASTALMRR